MKKEIDYLNLKDAREQFPSLIRHVSSHTSAYLIGTHNHPKALLIDLKTAKRYLPKEYLNPTSSPKKSGQLFKEFINEWLPKKTSKRTSKTTLSQDIDKIVYGL